MNLAKNIKQSLENKGVYLEVSGEDLKLLGKVKRLSEAEKLQIVALKPQVIAYLLSKNPPRVAEVATGSRPEVAEAVPAETPKTDPRKRYG